MKLFDSEWKIMSELWRDGDLSAKELSLRMQARTSWNKNTTYTVIKKCIEKGAIERREPNFLCHALLSRRDARQEEAQALVERAFDGSAELLLASLLGRETLSPEKLAQLRRLVEESDE